MRVHSLFRPNMCEMTFRETAPVLQFVVYMHSTGCSATGGAGSASVAAIEKAGRLWNGEVSASVGNGWKLGAVIAGKSGADIALL